MPKSLAYVSTWKNTRENIKDNLTLLIDCSKAFEHANLEMLIYLINEKSKIDSYKTASFEQRKYLTKVNKTLISLFEIFPLGVKDEELNLGIKIRKNIGEKLTDCGKHIWGDIFYKEIKQEKSDFKVLGGKEIQKYFIKSKPKGFISKYLTLSIKSKIQENSILLQRIISCVSGERTAICGSIIEKDKERYRVVNTIHQIVCKPYLSNRLILGILHSKVLNWYCYAFVFAKARLSFQFSGESVGRIPLPKLNDKSLCNEIISLVDKILETKALDSNSDTSNLESKIDSLVYKLYGLNSEEIKIIEGGEK